MLVLTPRENYLEAAAHQTRRILSAAQTHPSGPYPQDELQGTLLDAACWEFLQETMAQTPTYTTILTDLSWQQPDNAPDVRVDVRFSNGRRVSLVYHRNERQNGITGCEDIRQ